MLRATSFRLTLLPLVAGLLLVGCAHQPAVRGDAARSTSPVSAAGTAQSSAQHQRRAAASAQTGPAAADSKLPETTGIAACDDYLTSYMACHRAAQIFSPDQLPARYEAMRTSLLRDSMNPDIRPQLAARCNSLATQLRQALHGKSCDVNPAAASSASP